MRGWLLSGCVIAFTGVVAEAEEATFASQPLCALVRLYGGEVTLSVDEATHLVACKKEGWKHSTKIRRAHQRCQEDPGFVAVWEHWLLDCLCLWQRQPEASYEGAPH